MLEIDDLSVTFHADEGDVHAVNGLSLEIGAGETVAIVGESGCGKSVTSLSILGLVSERVARTSGAIRFNGRNLLALSQRELRRLRGGDISMIFQDPMTSLNPVLTIGWQLEEAIRLHQHASPEAAKRRAVEMLKVVGIPLPEQRIKEYPHQLSGGMRQRVMIAMALSCNPKLLIADEPTTALDVTIQAQILNLMRDLKSDIGSAIMLITHDLGVVAEMAERVVVMYAGRKVEEAPVDELFSAPKHPYTRGLLGAVPKLGSSLTEGRHRLAEVRGSMPDPHKPVVGCPFAERCDLVSDICRLQMPPIELKAPAHLAACHNVPADRELAEAEVRV